MMTDKKLRQQLEHLDEAVPSQVHDRVQHTLWEIRAGRHDTVKQTRFGVRRAAVILLAAMLMLGAAALAAEHWGIYDHLSFMLGSVPQGEGAAVQTMLHQETVNGVEITVQEAMYDGRTLFLQYSYRILDETESFAVMKGGEIAEGLTDEAAQKLNDKNVGWWIDAFWVDGKRMDMAAGSGSTDSGTEVPGEIVHTEYWRLDAIDVELDGVVEIALPIGQRQPLSEYTRKDHPEKYGEDGELMKPDKGLVTFTFDAGAAKEAVVTVHPDQKTVTPEVTAWVEEAAFSPMMTYYHPDSGRQ